MSSRALPEGSLPSLERLGDYLRRIDAPNSLPCRRLLADHAPKIMAAPGSFANHQAWPWGYVDHLVETMFLVERFYAASGRPLPFSLSDTFLVLFLHDLEKPWKFAWSDVEKTECDSFADYVDFVFAKSREYGIELSDDHRNALRYVHGEWSDYTPHARTQCPLAAFAHICDTASARIFFEYPLRTRSND